MLERLYKVSVFAAAAMTGALCACHALADSRSVTADAALQTREPVLVFRSAGNVRLGAPLAVAIDFDGVAVVADGSPGRLVRVRLGDEASAQEYQRPTNSPGFYPTDVAVRGFFMYAIDETSRRLLRFEKTGSYRDVLLNFERVTDSRRVSPYGLDVDPSGRIAVTDVENHQVLLINNYLEVDVAFGAYGAYEGQLDTPLGVSFSPNGELIVADTGNARVQFFSDGGGFLRSFPPAGTGSPLERPRRAVQSKTGFLYVADPAAESVLVFDRAGAVVGSLRPSGDVSFEPSDVEVSREGTVLVTDTASQSLFVFKGM